MLKEHTLQQVNISWQLKLTMSSRIFLTYSAGQFQRAVSTLSPDVMQEQSMAIRNASSEGLMVRRTLYVIALEMRRKLLNSNMDPSMDTTDLVGNINIAEDIVTTYNSLYDACTQRPQSDTIFCSTRLSRKA